MKLVVNELTKRYGGGDGNVTVIDRLNYVFPESGSVAILGPSGIGKSTLLHLLSGIDSATSGQIVIDDTEITKLSEDELALFRRDHIGFVFQFHHLLPEFHALENVAMPLFLRDQDQESAFAAAEEVLTRVGLAHRLLHRPGELSGGEQQRVALARALVAHPKLLLADEPTGNLDQGSASEVADLLFELNGQEDKLLIVVTHSKEFASRMDHVLEMSASGELLPVVLTS